MEDMIFTAAMWLFGVVLGFSLNARSWFAAYRQENDQLRAVIITLVAKREAVAEDRLVEPVVDEEAKEWLIRKGIYFYRPNRSGYTTDKTEAGRYTKADAEREARVEPWHMTALHQDEVPNPPWQNN